MPPTTTTSAREARSVPFRMRRPASVDVPKERLRADHERRAAGARLGQQVLHRAADGDHVAQRGADADLPQPRHVVLGRAARVVGRVDHVLARLAQRRDGLDGARRGLVADPHAAVEIEDELVVALRDRGERHVASLRRRAQASRSPARARSRWRSPPAAVTTTRAAARRPRPKTSAAAAQTEQAQGVCRDVEQPTPRDGGGQKKPKQPLDHVEDLHGRRSRPPAARSRSGWTRGPRRTPRRRSRARPQRLLRRHDLPPHRARAS